MKMADRFLLAVCNSNRMQMESVKAIAQKMTPIKEANLKLPRGFAHTVRVLLDEEIRTCTNKAPEVSSSRLSKPDR